MPRVHQNQYDYLVKDRIKALHGELLAEGIRDTEVAKWLNCTSQNVSAHFKRASFSFRQILIIEDHLKKLRDKRLAEH